MALLIHNMQGIPRDWRWKGAYLDLLVYKKIKNYLREKITD